MMTPFAKRLIAARNAADMSQEELALAIHVAQSTVATWERGKNEPDLKTIERIAKAVDSRPEWLGFAVGSDSPDLTVIDEIDARAQSGAGGIVEITDESRGEFIAHRYGFPRGEFKEMFGANPGDIVIIQVIGDSMLGTLNPGERVFVNLKDRTPSPPGIFVVWDGIGLVMKRVEYLAHSKPPRIRIMSDNPKYEPYERTIDEAFIQGRVIGSWQRR
jgi:phage repressor protein C with HTH and peptisase S24 domain